MAPFLLPILPYGIRPRSEGFCSASVGSKTQWLIVRRYLLGSI